MVGEREGAEGTKDELKFKGGPEQKDNSGLKQTQDLRDEQKKWVEEKPSPTNIGQKMKDDSIKGIAPDMEQPAATGQKPTFKTEMRKHALREKEEERRGENQGRGEILGS